MKIFVFVIFYTCALFSQGVGSGIVKGHVKNEQGMSVQNVVIYILNQNITTETDSLGEYTLKEVPLGSQKLVFDHNGQKDTSEITVHEHHVNHRNHVMTENLTSLDDVTITHFSEKYVVNKPSESLRLTAPLIEIPQNIAVATKQTLKDFGITGTAQATRLTSGIVARYSSANDYALTIRGTDATNNVFRNGVGSYWWNQQEDAAMLERIEFVKGPAGFMIGNSEPGGLLNVVTKQATGEKIKSIDIGIGSWNLLRGSVDFGGNFTPKSRFSYRLVAGGNRQNGLTNYYTSNRLFAVGSMRYNYKNDSYVQAESNYMTGLGKGNYSSLLSHDGVNSEWASSFATHDPAIKGITTGDKYFRINQIHKFAENIKWNNQVALVNGIYKGDGMYMSGFNEARDTLYRQYYNIDWRNQVYMAQSFVDFTFNTTVKIKHSILAGIDFGNTSVKSKWGEIPDTTYTILPISVKNPTYNLTKTQLGGVEFYPEDSWGTQWTSFYAQDHIKIYNKVIVTLAGRFSYTKSWASYDSNTVYNSKFTPRFGLTYLVNKNMSVYTLYDQSFLPQTGRKEDRTNAKPLTGDNAEIGFKAKLFKEQVMVNSSLFHTVKNNLLVQNPLNQLYVERGQVTSDGFEIDFVGKLHKNISANLNYTYTNARVTKDADSAIVGFKNYGTSAHVGNAMVRYKFNKYAVKGLSIGLGAQLIGQRSAVWAGWTDPRDKGKTIPSYIIYDVNAMYERGTWNIAFYMYNMTNKRYSSDGFYNSSYNDDGVSSGYYGAIRGNPINFMMTVSVLLHKIKKTT